MPNRVSKIFQYLRDKLSSLLGFVKFLVIPQNKYLRTILIGVVLVFIFGSITIVYAASDPDIFDQILNLLNVFLFMVASGLGWVAMKIFGIIVWVSGYNDFVTSAAVTKGWVLVRDICNMFFVVILLVIAFAQILGVQKYSMKTLLPKVLIAAILVNFSKLICGLFIDMAQVVMMTFVNGYQATAGANLIQGLGLVKLLALSDEATNPGGGTGPAASEIFVAMLLACFVILATIFVSFFIALLLLMRIVTLWILVVLSPAAFMLSTVPFGQSKANEWWQKFGWTVAVGPFMAFFLWLSLLIMSNPEDMMGDSSLAETEAAIQAKDGKSTGEASYLKNIAQAAIGLSMLMASLMAAQEAGGAMGSLAQTGQKVTAGALKKTAMKVSGAQSVVDRGAAVGAGWKARSEAKKAAVMSKWQQRGAGASNLKDKALGVIKKAPVAPAAAVMGGATAAIKMKMKQRKVRKEAMAKAKLENPGITDADLKARGDAAVNKLKQNEGGVMKAALQGGKAAGWTNMGIGGMDKRMASEGKKANQEARRAEATKNLEGRGIKTKEQKEQLLDTTMAPGPLGSEGRDMQRAALLSLAEKGELSEHHGEMGRKMFKNDEDGLKAFTDAMKKKQAHLAYEDLSKPENAKKLSDDIDSGDVDLSKLDESSYADSNFMAAAHGAVGGKRFSEDVTKASKRSAKHKKTISKALTQDDFSKSILQDISAAQEKHNQLAAMPGADPEEVAASQEQLQEKKDSYKELGKTVVSITGDASRAFTRRQQNHDPTDSSYTTNPENVGKVYNNPSTGAPMIDTEALKSYISSVNAKDLTSMKIDPSIEAHVAPNIQVSHLTKLVKSSESGSDTKMKDLMKVMARQLASGRLSPAENTQITEQLSLAINNEQIAGAIDNDVKAALLAAGIAATPTP